jgi:hypothetical protein
MRLCSVVSFGIRGVIKPSASATSFVVTKLVKVPG